MTKKIIIGNWKENPNSIEHVESILEITDNNSGSIKNAGYLVLHAAPSIYAGMFSKERNDIILQNISHYKGGSHTGEISSEQAKSAGISASIVGHSETRLSPKNPKGDEDFQVNLKIKNLIEQEMFACLCVGEHERSTTYMEFIKDQIKVALKDIPKDGLEKIIIAYEPIWAIGEGSTRPASKEEIIETITGIKEYLKEEYGQAGESIKVLYGGSVDERNVKEIVSLQVVDGALIGRASSDAAKWDLILKTLSRKQRSIDNLNIQKGTKVLVRFDYNVPINTKGGIENTYRIDESLSTIKRLTDLGAELMILAHRESGSLSVVYEYLKTKLDNIWFQENLASVNTGPGQVTLFENIRLDEREKSKDEKKRDELGAELSSLAQVFINDAFSASHRDHASITSVPKFIPSAFGPNFINEVEKLSLALDPKKPSLLILGGAKFDTKLKLLEKFSKISDRIFVGGALAHTFWNHKGYNLGKSLIDKEVKVSGEILNSDKIMLPTDVVKQDGTLSKPDKVSDTDKIVDFGGETLRELVEVANRSNTIIWNGPLGYYEGGFDKGSLDLILSLSKLEKKTIILGGGDTVALIERYKKLYSEPKFTHISSAGGAMIDFLSNGTLPGIQAIK